MKNTASDLAGLPYDPLSMASLQLWKQENQEDNRPRIERLLRNLPLAMEEELNAQAVVLRHLHRGAARAGIGPALFPGGHAVKAAVVPHAGAQAPHQGRDRQEHCGGQFDFPDDAFHDGFPHLSSEFPSAAAVVLCTVMLLYLCAIVNQKNDFRYHAHHPL